MQKVLRKRIVMPVVALAAIAVASIAVAYFTADGTGTGTASVGTDSGVSITNVTFDSTLYPGGSTVVRFTVENDSSNTSVKVDKVVADTVAGTNGITGLPAGCEASDFSFAAVTVGREIAADGSVNAIGRLELANSARNQNACKGASPVLNLKVDNSGI